MRSILVADDEEEIVELIELFLSKENLNIIKAYDGKQALEYIEKEDISLGIIDIMMPNINGFEVIKKIRKEYNIPLIILSARDDFSNKILGLDIGADDYITKPFNPLELVARVQAQLRRFYQLNSENTSVRKGKSIIEIGDLALDKEGCTLYKNDKIVQLTPKEYKILEYFINHIGRVFTKQQIFEYIWNENYYDDENAIRVHISNIREKIEDDPKKPKYLKTVRGLGYKFDKI